MRRKAVAEAEAGPQVVARPAPSAAALPLQPGTVALKLLKAAPRGNCVREHHGLATLKGVQFAEQVRTAVRKGVGSCRSKTWWIWRFADTTELSCLVQVQVERAGVVLSSKDKKTVARLRQPAAAMEGEASGDPLLGEPQTFYCIHGECRGQPTAG